MKKSKFNKYRFEIKNIGQNIPIHLINLNDRNNDYK